MLLSRPLIHALATSSETALSTVDFMGEITSKQFFFSIGLTTHSLRSPSTRTAESSSSLLFL